jgi:hypothetical protein
MIPSFDWNGTPRKLNGVDVLANITVFRRLFFFLAKAQRRKEPTTAKVDPVLSATLRER